MKVLVVGGGSGGHVTPAVAVIKELKKSAPRASFRFWCDKGFIDRARSIVGVVDSSIEVQPILGGKLRRYNGISWWGHLRQPSIVWPNVRDGFLVFVGFWQSLFKLIAWRPNVVFAKGGFVCLPVGLAAKVLRIPLVIHDSDAHPGLTNRVLARFANYIATGAPLEYYDFPKKRSHYTGIPISEEFTLLNKKAREDARQEWGMGTDLPLVVVTGGGLGAKRINDAVNKSIEELLETTQIVLVSGRDQYESLAKSLPLDNPRLKLEAFVYEGMAKLVGSADAVVARAGATTILELAALGVPTVLVPNPYLTSGHQLKNAAVYADKGAVLVVDEEEMDNDATVLSKAIKSILSDPEQASAMGKRFREFAKPKAAREVADLVLKASKK
jgi:UDP-N-acetylglucosamine--N-acetylmuramyl-(pentapeptide) pyrophosphoryl-undecaprenol N-acetylglucosamine transferase